MQVITYTKKVAVVKIFFGLVLFLAAVGILLMGSLFFGVVFAVIAIGMINREGSEIDIENKTYRKINSYFGIKTGKWQKLPKIEYVSVFKTKESQTVNVATASTTFTDDIILLNLFYGNKSITAYKTKDKTDAFNVAQHLALALEIDILDATEREKKWL